MKNIIPELNSFSIGLCKAISEIYNSTGYLEYDDAIIGDTPESQNIFNLLMAVSKVSR